MGEKSIFISSCSRRELARRRPTGMSARTRHAGFADVGSGRPHRSGFGAGARRGRGRGFAAAVTVPGAVLGLPVLGVPVVVLALCVLAAITVALGGL